MIEQLYASLKMPILSRDKNALERFFSLFSVVEPGEGLTALLLTVNVFLLLGAYYILKVVREALILAESGAEVASYSSAGQAVLLLLVVPAYAAFAARTNRIQLVTWATLFFVSHLGIFFLLGNAGVRIGIAYYLWIGIFNVFVVAQFWAFANDIYTKGQGERLFPIIGVGASLGAWVGTAVISDIFESVGPYVAMLIGAAVLLVCVAITRVVNRRGSGRDDSEQQAEASAAFSKEGGFQLVWNSRYLRYIALLILLLNLVNTTGGYLLNSLVVAAASELPEANRAGFIGSYIGGVYAWVNLLGLLIQMFIVSRVFRFIGARGALFVLPVIAIGGYVALMLAPALGLVRIVKIAENSTDYSLMNTIRAALYLPTSRDVKYKAKQAIDTFFVRFGDLLQAGLVFGGLQLGFGIREFATVNVAMCVLWLGTALVIFREHKKLTAQ
jgi:AAA family ATP:ADP antiporter